MVGRLSAYLGLTDDEQAHVHQKLKETRGLSRFKPFTVKVDIGREALDVYEAHRAEIGAAVAWSPPPTATTRWARLAATRWATSPRSGPRSSRSCQAEGRTTTRATTSAAAASSAPSRRS